MYAANYIIYVIVVMFIVLPVQNCTMFFRSISPMIYQVLSLRGFLRSPTIYIYIYNMYTYIHIHIYMYVYRYTYIRMYIYYAYSSVDTCFRYPFDIESSFHVQHLQANTGTDEIAFGCNRGKMQRYVKSETLRC